MSLLYQVHHEKIDREAMHRKLLMDLEFVYRRFAQNGQFRAFRKSFMYIYVKFLEMSSSFYVD